MERFTENGGLIVPDRDAVMKELQRHGVHYEHTVHIHQAFCPNGHQLITDDNEKFDGLPGIKLLCKHPKENAIVYLSPVLNVRRRSGGNKYVLGDRLQVCCPVCEVAMPVLAPCDCQWDGEYVMLSLAEDYSKQHGVCFCNIWGCPKGDIRLAGEVIAEYQRNYEL